MRCCIHALQQEKLRKTHNWAYPLIKVSFDAIQSVPHECAEIQNVIMCDILSKISVSSYARLSTIML